MKSKYAFTLLLPCLLAACGDTGLTDSRQETSPKYLTRQEVERVGDLSELGEMAFENGNLTIGGKVVGDVAVIQGKTYGRIHNPLNLSDEVLNSVDIAARNVLVFGSRAEALKLLQDRKVDTSKLSLGDVDRPISMAEMSRASDGEFRANDPKVQTQPSKGSQPMYPVPPYADTPFTMNMSYTEGYVYLNRCISISSFGENTYRARAQSIPNRQAGYLAARVVMKRDGIPFGNTNTFKEVRGNVSYFSSDEVQNSLRCTDIFANNGSSFRKMSITAEGWHKGVPLQSDPYYSRGAITTASFRNLF